MNRLSGTALSEAVKFQVDLRQVIYALSDALDLVGIDDLAHGKRVGIMAAACGRAMGCSRKEVSQLFDLGLLHDIGVSSTSTHSALVREFDWESSQLHCLAGSVLLQDFPLLSQLADPVRYHHTHWDALLGNRAVSPEVARQANLIYLVDRVDALAAPHYAEGVLLMDREAIRQQIAAHAGSFFATELVEAFFLASSTEAFWLSLEPRSIQSCLQEMLRQAEPCVASMADLKRLAAIFSRIVDAKSPFTAQHSLGVARLARYLAEEMGIGEENCDKLEIAGLLHDLGKLRVPDEVLEKPGALDERERKMMNGHSYETFQILRQIAGFEEITQWAACHHEEPDATGYPFRLQGLTLPLEARILRVADIFQAMAQNRPYRSGLSGEAVIEFLNRMAEAGRVEPEIVAVAARNLPAAMAAACPQEAIDLATVNAEKA